MDAEEHVLREVLREIAAPGETKRQRKHEVLVGVDEGGERGLITVPAAPDDFAFVRLVHPLPTLLEVGDPHIVSADRVTALKQSLEAPSLITSTEVQWNPKE
jgi:hypothetical protein